MDVSRIEAISPRNIDWQRLTAKEIINYRQEGLDVPTQYIQWAQSFINSIQNDDETTYEMATSNQNTDTQNITEENTQPQSTQETQNTQSQASQETPTEDNQATSSQTDETKTPAQQEREELNNNGTSITDQAKIFINKSDTADLQTESSVNTIESILDNTTAEISSLEDYMEQLISDIETKQQEIVKEVDKLNSNDTKGDSISKINKLKKEIETYGRTGQNKAMQSYNAFNSWDNTLNAQDTIYQNATDYGTETISIGEEIKQEYAFLDIFTQLGTEAVNSGQTAVGNAQNATIEKNEILDINGINKSSATDFQNEIYSKTGISAKVSENKNDENKDQATTTSEDTTTKTQDSTKDKQETQNDEALKINQTDEALNTNFDKIVLAKIRRGEQVST